MDTEHWAKMSLITWNRILQESIDKKDKEREKYAKWMLTKVLKDSDST